MSETTGSYDALADQLGLNDKEEQPATSTFWGHLDGNDLGAAVVDRVKRFRQWQMQNGLLAGWRLKTHYYYNEYRAGTGTPHLAVMEQFGAAGEFQFLSLNFLRGILNTLKAAVCENPPTFSTKAVNSDADALEGAAIYQGILDYYTRDLRLPSKINKAVEMAIVMDQAFMLVEWDAFSTDGPDPAEAGIWSGSPVVKVLSPLDVFYDFTKTAWSDLDWVIVRDWADREKVRTQFPEFVTDIDASQSRAQVVLSNSATEGNTRYEMGSFEDLSNDIQIFKLYFRDQPWMPKGRFCMFLENGTMIFESPGGLIYPKLPVERMVCADQLDILLGYSPINEMLACQESINCIVSAISTNAQNYGNQYVACVQGTQLNPRTLMDGQKIIEYPPGMAAPVGLNLTAIPETLFSHLKDLQAYMMTIPGVSNSSRGQTGGANQTGSSMLFLQSQTTQNQGEMSQNYQDFCAAVCTSLLHVLRVFARTSKSVEIAGKNVASKTIILAEALKNFDEVVVDMTNPIMQTASGRMQFAQTMMQFGNSTPQEALEVAQTGNIGPAVDPAQEQNYELNLENEWLLNGETVLVNALDNHQTHIAKHTQLFSVPWMRKPDLAQKLQITNAPQIQQTIQQHIMQHMQFLKNNQASTVQTNAPVAPGAPQAAPQPALGHLPQPSGAAPPNSPQQGAAVAQGTHLPSPPSQPSMPK